MMFDAVTTMSEQAKAGKVKALATSGKTRSSVMPNVPTVSEAGVPGYEAVIWLGVMAPKGTPPAIVNRLNAEIAKIVDKPEVRAEWAKQGAVGDDDDARRVRALRRRRHREVGEGDQGLRREGRPVSVAEPPRDVPLPDLVVLSRRRGEGPRRGARTRAFAPTTGAGVAGTFGAVGAIREKFARAATPCDVLILTARDARGALRGDGARSARHDRAARPRRSPASPCAAASRIPRIDDRAALRATFAARRGAVLPRPRARDGRHPLRRRCCASSACGPTSRRGCAPTRRARSRCARSREDRDPGLVGCTQVTEILYTPGVDAGRAAARGVHARDRRMRWRSPPARAPRARAPLRRDAHQRRAGDPAGARRLPAAQGPVRAAPWTAVLAWAASPQAFSSVAAPHARSRRGARTG